MRTRKKRITTKRTKWGTTAKRMDTGIKKKTRRSHSNSHTKVGDDGNNLNLLHTYDS